MRPAQTESMIRKTPKAKPLTEAALNSPQPPDSQENGGLIGAARSENTEICRADALEAPAINRHEGAEGGELMTPPVQAEAEDCAEGGDLDELVTRAIRSAKRGRPAAFDDHAKGKLVALLALGLSLRQAASVIGVHHKTIANTLKADPALAEEITAARFQAQVQPLACVVRESRRSWKAATWLLKYLDGKIASREETPDELRERRRRESDEAEARIEASRKAANERYRREARGEV